MTFTPDGVLLVIASQHIAADLPNLEPGTMRALAWGERIDDPDEVPLGVGVPRADRIDEELVERFWREGLSDREIGERVGCSYRSVFRVRKRMGWETKWAA